MKSKIGWFKGIVKIGYCIFRLILHALRIRPYDKELY